MVGIYSDEHTHRSLEVRNHFLANSAYNGVIAIFLFKNAFQTYRRCPLTSDLNIIIWWSFEAPLGCIEADQSLLSLDRRGIVVL